MEVMHLQRLLACLENSDVAEIDWREADFHLRLSMLERPRPARSSAFSPEPAAAGQGPTVTTERAMARTAGAGHVIPTTVRATTPGVFLVDHPEIGTLPRTGGSPDATAPVRAGDLIGLLRAGPLYLPVTAPVDGRLTKRVATPGTAVGYGQALFEMSAGAMPPSARAMQQDAGGAS